MDQNNVQLFEDQPIRTAWDEEYEEWYFSIIDVIRVLTDQPEYQKARKYWNKLKQRLNEEGSQLVTNCHQLKMTSQDGKKRQTDVADTEQLLRLIQSIHRPERDDEGSFRTAGFTVYGSGEHRGGVHRSFRMGRDQEGD